MEKGVSGKALDFKLLRRVFAFAKPYRKRFYFALLSTAVLAFVSPLRPWLVQYTVDNCIIHPDYKNLVVFSALMLGLLISETLLQYFDSYLSNWVGHTVIRDLRIAVFKHISNFKLSYYDNNAIGTLVTRTVSDTETIADVFSQGLLTIFGDLLKLIVLITVMFYTDVKLSLAALSTVPVLLFATYIFKNAVKSAFQEVRTQVARLNAFVQEHIQGMMIVQTFSKEQQESDKFKAINLEHTKANIKSVWHYSVFFPVVEILSSISLGLLVWFGASEVVSERVTLGNLIAFIMYINMLFRPIRMLADRFNTLQMGMVCSERVFKVLDTNETIDNQGNYVSKGIKGEIEFKDVWFAYKGEEWVLRGVSFKINPGECYALVGATGSGKTSIANLINRFYEFQKGEILIDGVDIRKYDLNFLRRNIGIVLQDAFLFSDSILKNITFGDTISLEEVIEASKEIETHSFIMQLPDNYYYNVRERGATLSVGQRQLLSFLRVYVHKPSVLVLDEATSSIDSQSEVLIQKATEKITQGRTSIIIAHRLSTIRNASKILVIEKGKVIEDGTHTQLMKNFNGHYRKLFEMQTNNVEA